MTGRSFEAVVIGASSGAVEALTKLLALLPLHYPLPVMIVVHVPPDQKSVMANVIMPHCKLKVCEADDKEPVAAGVIYFAPADYHLQVEKSGTLSLSNDEPVLYSRPSIDVLFETAADAYEDALIGVVLTGSNSDGAEGLRAVTQAGGVGIVQDPREAYAPTMPRAALKACPQAHVLTLEKIALFLQKAAAP